MNLLIQGYNMFSQQQKLSTAIPQIQTWLDTYQVQQENFQDLVQQIQHFQIRIPLIGAFSAGKSSLINALIDEKLLSLDITPETGIATELNYSMADEIIGHYSNGSTERLNRSDMQEQTLAKFAPDGWIEANIPADVLKPYPHVRLVDLPGLSSGNEIHGKAIDNYMARSLAYCVVVSVEDGELSQTTQNFLQELSL